MCLLNIQSRKDIKIQFTKVKAHSQDTFNNQVDQLAKEAREEPEVHWKELSKILPMTTPFWNNIPIDMSIRTFIKDWHEREVLIQ